MVNRRKLLIPPRPPLVAAAGLAAALAVAGVATGYRGDVTVVSSRSGGGAAGARSYTPEVSVGGRYVVFSSDAQNLSGLGAGGQRQVYRRDMATGGVEIVSRANGTAGAPGDGTSFEDASTSRGGNRVTFASNADNLSSADNKNATDVFVRDLGAGTTTLISTTPSGTAQAGSFQPSISGDGEWVAFTSNADNMSEADDNLSTNVFIRPVSGGVPTLVNVSAGPPAVNRDSRWPSVSGDGSRVAFESVSDALTPGQDGPESDVFVFNRFTGTVDLVSRGAGGGGTDGGSTRPAISEDGRWVAFESTANNLTGVDRHDGNSDVFVRDLATGQTSLVSRADGPSGAPGDGSSTQADISADGRYVAFTSTSDNLSPSDRDGFSADVFVRDLVLGRTYLVSRAPGDAGAPADDDSDDPGISPDGDFVAFESDADDLGAVNTSVRNVFVREVFGADPPFTGGGGGGGGGGAGGGGNGTGGGTTTTTPGGGTTSVPAPVITLSGGRLVRGRWQTSLLRGAAYTAQMSLSGAGHRARIEIRRGGALIVRRDVRAGARGRAVVVPLPPSARPGAYTVTASDLSGALAPVLDRFVLRPPPEGLARNVFVSNARSGRAVRVVPARGPFLVAGFVFVVQPRGFRTAAVAFTDPIGRTTLIPKPILGAGISAYVDVRPALLRRGTWTISLRVGGRVVSRVRVPVR